MPLSISIFKHPGFRKYFKNTGWLFLDKGLRLIAGLFIGAWVARYLGPGQFGRLSYIQSFVAIGGSIATLGIDEIVVRELVRNKGRRDAVLGTAFFLKAFGALALFTVMGIAVRFTSNDGFTNALIFLLALASVFQVFKVIESYFLANILAKYPVWASIIAFVVYSIMQVVLVLMKAPVGFFVAALVVQSCILALGWVYFYHAQDMRIGQWSFDTGTAGGLLRDSWPLIVSGTVIMLYMRIDQVMIKEMLGIQALGNYAAAVMLSEAGYFIPIVLGGSLFPAIMNAKEKGGVHYHDRLQKFFCLFSWAALAIALPVFFFSKGIIHLFYGEKYAQAASVLSIHIWIIIFAFFGVAKGRYMMAENIQWLSAVYSSAGALCNILLNLVLIPRMGIQGAAWASLAAQVLSSVVLPSFHRKDRKSVIMLFKSIFSINTVSGWFGQEDRHLVNK